ncbi:cuticular protein 66D [Musca autumnalis]|uniref:cuticular protein 66D n=1 Tax=Musca autumnalis TaxID=221902 RepID=UPI003CF3FAE4
MRGFVIIVTLAVLGHVGAQQHQQIDPAYLRQYYQQLQQQTGAAGDATPIYEQNSEQTQQYITPGQQLRVKDNVQEQVRASQQQHQQQQGYVAPAVREYLQHQQHQQQPQQIQYQAPQQVYRQPQAVAPAPRRPQAVPQQYQAPRPKSKAQIEEEEEYEDQNSSYQFGFDVKDDEFTNYQNRKEVRDGGVIKGSYSVVDSDGFIRTVKYTADPKEGFKAEVIREPTDIVVKIPTPAPQHQGLLRPHAQAVKAQDYNLKQQYQPQYQH